MTDAQKHAIVAYLEIQLFIFLEKHQHSIKDDAVNSVYGDVYDILDDLEETLQPSTVEACFIK